MRVKQHAYRLGGIDYHFGWVRGAYDPRAIRWQAPRQLAQGLPDAFDLQPMMPPVYDQGSQGSCGPNSLCGILQFLAMMQQLSDQSLQSRAFVYWITRQLMGTTDQDSGVDNPTMLKALKQFGYIPDTEMPYNDQDYTTQPSSQDYADALPHAVDGYAGVDQNEQTISASIAAKQPVLFGFTVYESMLSQQVARTGMVPMPTGRDRVAGGHDVVLVGYDSTKRLYKFRNSWSISWGQNGYGFFPYDYVLNPNLAGEPGGIAGWIIPKVPGGQPTPPPPPPPPGSLGHITLINDLKAGTYTLS